MIDAFGWTWEYIDEEMTLPRLEKIVAHWDAVPPLSVSVAAIASVLGVGRKGPRPSAKPREEDPRALIDLLGGAAGFSMSTKRPAWLTTPM